MAQFIDKEDELDTLLVGYFCKILVVLMRKRPERSEDFFAENPAVLEKLLRHSTSLCVADFLTNLLGAGMQVRARARVFVARVRFPLLFFVHTEECSMCRSRLRSSRPSSCWNTRWCRGWWSRLRRPSAWMPARVRRAF